MFLSHHHRRGIAAVTLLCTTQSFVAPSLAWALEPEASPPPERAADALDPASLQAGDRVGNQPALKDSAGKADRELAKEERAIAQAPDKSVSAVAADVEVAHEEGVQARALPTGEDKTGVSTQALSLPKGPGTIEGLGESFSAQLTTGVVTFDIPFQLPAARGAAQPKLGLSYSSGSGAGVGGLGWSVGVPFIARQADRGVPSYDDRAGFHHNQDRFVFNGGQELVPICVVSDALTCDGALPTEQMPPWSAGSQYFRPRVEGSFQRFFWAPSRLTWRVQDKSGVTLELGVPLDGSGSRGGLDANPANPEQIYRWHLVRQYDVYGGANPSGPLTLPTPSNVVVYRYLQDGGMAYLSDIFDTSPAGSPTTLDTSLFAHHTRLIYEDRSDPSSSYKSGWRIDFNKRLARVDVTSKTYAGTPTDPRRRVRSYQLRYDTQSHVSLLAAVQAEGRCATTEASAPAELGDQTLAPGAACELLPSTRFEYSRVEPFTHDGKPSVSQLAGYEGFDHRVRSFETPPSHSLDEELADLFDVNADALPDVLVTMPGKYGSGHGVFFNAAGGVADSFGGVESMDVVGVQGESGGTLKLSNLNVSPLDLDGDGIVDLLHMPRVKTYSVYTPVRAGSKWSWRGRVVQTAGAQNPKVDFGQDGQNLRTADVNGDGLIDVVLSTGTELQTFFSLGRYPGGDGQFGVATRTSATTASISTEPVRHCVPFAGTALSFSVGGIRLADMNGDGLPDLVSLDRSNIRYWPGRGNGMWGTGDRNSCPAGTYGQGQHIQMEDAPESVSANVSELRIDDVNGDGLDDLVQVRFNEVDVWLNVDGQGWTTRQIIDATPANPGFANRVRITDINGSGTRDIVWGEAGNYSYIDLQGGKRPWLLQRVENGLGKTTALEYTTSTEEMRVADQNGGECNPTHRPWASPWCTRMPIVVPLVKRVTVSDNVTIAGQANPPLVTTYSYRDPVYEGRQREFRGFRKTLVTNVGDANSPTLLSETTSLLGECEDETADQVDDCAISERWRDNPREALKGLPLVTEHYNQNGVYLSTTANTYRLRKLYEGLDGRQVRQGFSAGIRVARYDTDVATSPQPTFSSLGLVETQLDPDTAFNPYTCVAQSTEGQLTKKLFDVPLRAPPLYAVIESRSTLDYFGNPTSAVAAGCVAGTECPGLGADTTGFETDETICKFSSQAILPSGQSTGWLYRSPRRWTVGSRRTVARADTTTEFNAQGAPTRVLGALAGTVPLDRFHAVAGRSVVATAPNASADNPALVVSELEYDVFGNVTRVKAPNGRCRDTAYDALPDAQNQKLGYEHLPTVETVYTGGCGINAITTTAVAYDRGLGQASTLVDAAGQTSMASYDGLGRFTAFRAPRPDGVLVTLSDLPSQIYTYDLPTDSNRRGYSILLSRTQDGSAITDNEYTESYAFVDGLGRVRALVAEADTTAGDEAGWLVSGVQLFDARGASARRFLHYFTSATPPLTPSAVTTPYLGSRFDAFGRLVETADLDGTITLSKRYNALTTHIWDAEDRVAGPHQGTHASTRTDGHGRAIAATERIIEQGVVQARDVRTQFLATGEPEVITRVRVGKADAPVVRWMKYDTMGRMLLNVDPHASPNFTADRTVSVAPSPSGLKAWRYAYNDAGDLVGTSDPRGCGQNFHYDSAGRLVAEDFSPCTAEHPLYSPPNLTTADGTEAFYQYDSLATGVPVGIGTPPSYVANSPYLRGRLGAIHDRGASSWFKYDARGRMVQASRKLAKNDLTVATPGARYTANWYQKSFTFDAANRVLTESTGATQLLAGGASTIMTTYSRRGLLKSLSSSYGNLIASVAHAADGLVNDVVYGDIAGTSTHFEYDGRRRIRALQTFRGTPSLWSTPPANYTPAPAPSPAPPSSFQLSLQDLEYVYDAASNPIEIRDFRVASEWPAGSKPVNRLISYDNLYRVKRIDYSYPGGSDAWVSPFAAELAGSTDPRRPQPPAHKQFTTRPLWQSYDYDWLGNSISSDDDQHGFYDRSLGAITNDVAGGKPYRITGATQATSPNSGTADQTSYDAAGNLLTLRVSRSTANCTKPGAACTYALSYQWDEVGRLRRAHRVDADTGTGPAFEYLYDSSDQRTLRELVTTTPRRITAYVFNTLELRGSQLDTGTNQFVVSTATEVPYLIGPNGRIGRVAFEAAGIGEPRIANGQTHLFLELPDHLGSTSLVIDAATSELVEATTRQPYGATESDYRPGRWKGFREDYGFTGKEEDVEVGLQYFGKRYLNPHLGRWISADPLAVHSPGQADLNLYAYVHGAVFKAIDRRGLDADVIIKGDTITVRARIYIYGDGASKEMAKAYQKSINDAWAKDPSTGGDWTVDRVVDGELKTYKVKFDVKVSMYKDQHPTVIPDKYRPANTDNFIEVASRPADPADEKSSFVRDGDAGVWRGYGRGGAALVDDNPAPHEFGHVVGLQDRYDNKRGDAMSLGPWSGIGTLRDNPKEAERWKGNIMADSASGKVDQRNINGIVGDALDEFLDARTELKNETGIELNYFRTQIDGATHADASLD